MLNPTKSVRLERDDKTKCNDCENLTLEWNKKINKNKVKCCERYSCLNLLESFEDRENTLEVNKCIWELLLCQHVI